VRRAAAVCAALAASLVLAGTAGGGPANSAETSAAAPAWARKAVFYGVVVERFGTGTFDSVRHRLGYLDRLGIRAIWLSPVNSTTPDDFGYAVTDYYGLRRSYGSKHDFRRLIEAAHARGIKVLMDLAPNHTSNRHPWFRRAQRQGPSSRYWDYYERTKDGRPKHYFDWANLPNLNYANPAVRHAVIRFSSYWIREFGIDGYRVDAAWGVRRRAPGFWPHWSAHLRAINPHAFLLAEASARRPYYLHHGFGGAYDWTRSLGRAAWGHVFDRPALAGERLGRALAASGGASRRGLIFRFLADNDTGERFIDRHGIAVDRVAAAALLTLPGAPLVYSGDEVGASYEPYDLPQPIDFSRNRPLRRYYRELIGARNRLGALTDPRMKIIASQGPLLAYVRPARGSQKPVLVVLNFSKRAQRVRIPDRPATRPFLEAKRLGDVTTHTSISAPDPDRPIIRVHRHNALVLTPWG
jgi:cyclomaltodextrinase